MQLAPLTRDLALILGSAGAVGFLFRRIRQPVVLGYIIAGILVGPYLSPVQLVKDLPNVRTWAQLGVIFLMFSLGLEFSFRRLSKVGLPASITASFEMALMMLLGSSCGRFFGWSFMDSIFLGAILSISSTTIIAKALDELGLKNRRFAQMIFGILIVEDLVAVLLLVALSSFSIHQSFSPLVLASSSAKLILVVGSWFLVGYFIVPRIFRHIGKTGSDEMLLVISLGFCLFLSVFADYFQYSVALGAFIMGSILAESSESRRIEELIKPMRDVFAAVFFVSVGMLLNPAILWEKRVPILIIAALVIVGKVVGNTLGSLLAGQSIKNSVQVSFGLTQIGEFSLIIATLGASLKVTSDFLYSVAVAVSVITTFTTPYMLRISQTAAQAFERWSPRSLKTLLSAYSAWLEERQAPDRRTHLFRQSILRWLLNGILVTAVWTLIAKLVLPVLGPQLSSPMLLVSLGWGLAILSSAPFIWAMLITRKPDAPRNRNMPFVFQLLTLIWLAALSFIYFPSRYVGLLNLVLAAVFFRQFYRRIEASYQWFEEQFLSTFRSSSTHHRNTTEALKELAPWDAHLMHIKVHADSELAGKPIQEAALRNKYGLNIVAIQRGSKVIVSPTPQLVIYPQDDLLVLGTDEQVEAGRKLAEHPHASAALDPEISDYQIRKLHIRGHSPLVGKTIRESKIRESYGAMVVGVERNDMRLLNPDTDLVLQIDDTLLIVGHARQIDMLLKPSKKD
ncbi:MAG: cation:proton antiporter [Bdellovibrionota bacterium]